MSEKSVELNIKYGNSLYNMAGGGNEGGVHYFLGQTTGTIFANSFPFLKENDTLIYWSHMDVLALWVLERGYSMERKATFSEATYSEVAVGKWLPLLWLSLFIFNVEW